MNIMQRIYRDFFMPIRVKEYDDMLAYAKENGYEFHTLRSFVQLPSVDNKKKYIILRRDVDTASNRVQRMMLQAEIKNGARCSSYFRINTLNESLMRQIEANGGEASYHYEEIATWCYKHRERRIDEVMKHLKVYQTMFINNVNRIRSKYSLPILTVSSHGEYVNRKLNIDNQIIVNEDVLRECGILIDAYNIEYLSKCTVRLHDHDNDDFVNAVKKAIDDREPVIEVLTHPRQWGAAAIINLLDDINRVCKQIYMNL